jgi:hypothetical protein
MMTEAPCLVTKTLGQILTFWSPGSQGDSWTWRDEYNALVSDPVTDAVRERVDAEGIGFADAHSPVLLGSDGRVWDGHHRIVIAIERGIDALDVELASGVTSGRGSDEQP